jgi:hypothetical protein
MKQIINQLALAFTLATIAATSLHAQVEVLSPDFTLFGKMNGDYCAEYIQITLPFSTNENYLFPEAGPFADERVYFLHRLGYFLPTLGVQTYFVPDDVYVYLPIIVKNWDNVATDPPFTPEQLLDTLRADVDGISGVRLSIDGVPLADLPAYRTESPLFSVYFPTADNIYSSILKMPIQGLDDPVVAGGYLVMLKPLPAGLHDVHTAYTFSEPDPFARERHYQVYSLTPPQFLAHKTQDLAEKISNSSLATNRKPPLLASLNAAKTSFESGNFQSGINQLGAFQNKVRAQVGPGDPALAEALSSAAQRVIDKAVVKLTRP